MDVFLISIVVCLFVHNHNIFCLSQKKQTPKQKSSNKVDGNTHSYTFYPAKTNMQHSIESITKDRAIYGSLNCRPVRRRCKVSSNKAVERQRQRPWRSSIPRLPERLVTYHSPRYLFGNDALSDNEST